MSITGYDMDILRAKQKLNQVIDAQNRILLQLVSAIEELTKELKISNEYEGAKIHKNE